MTKVDKDILRTIYTPLPLTRKPFKKAASKLKTTIDCLEMIKKYKKEGVIRRFGAVVNHRNIGLRANALVCWKVEKKRILSLGEVLCSFPWVSHCYFRKAPARWPYNFYTMVHAKTKKECHGVIKRLACVLNAKEYKVLFTVRELKKTRPVLDL